MLIPSATKPADRGRGGGGGGGGGEPADLTDQWIYRIRCRLSPDTVYSCPFDMWNSSSVHFSNNNNTLMHLRQYIYVFDRHTLHLAWPQEAGHVAVAQIKMSSDQ